MSIIPVAVVAGVWYHLARQGVATQTVWLGLNILDILRALRTTHHNGRNVGVKTRRKAMREAMVCWIAYVAIQQTGGIPDRLLSWIPLYSLVRSIFVSAFLVARITFSEAMYTSLVCPTLRHYENRIDLTLLLVHSIGSLIYHFAIKTPLERFHTGVRHHMGGLFRYVGIVPTIRVEVDSMDTSLGSIVSGIDQDAISISIQDLPPTMTGQKGSVRRQTRKIEDQVKNSSPAVILIHPSSAKSKVTAVRPISPYSTHFKQLAGIPRLGSASSPLAGNNNLYPVDSAMSSRQVSLRSKRSPAPTPELPAQAPRKDVFGEVTDNSASHSTAPSSTSMNSKRKLPVSVSSTNFAPRRRMLEPTRSLPINAVKPNPLAQPPRRLPIARDANVPRSTAPLTLAKSKSTLELGTAKTSSLSTISARPTKSAPTRRPLTDQSAPSSKAPTKRVPSAADRAKVIREAKRREETIDVGDKRKPVSSIGPEGSKRTKVHIVRD